MVLDHAFDIKFFNSNYTEAVDQPPCGLMNKIMATVSDTLMDTGQNLVGFSALFRTLLCLGLLAACFCQCLLVFAEEARVFNELAIGQSQKRVQPSVKANRFIRGRQRLRRHFTGNADEPLASLPPQCGGFRRPFYLAVELAFDFAYLGHIQVPVLEGYTVPELLEAQAVVSANTLDTRETRCSTGYPEGAAFFDPAEKRSERKIDTQGGILQKVAMNFRKFWELFTPARKMLFLRILADTAACRLIQEFALIEQAVIDQSQGVKSCVQARLLRPGGENTKLVALDCFDASI